MKIKMNYWDVAIGVLIGMILGMLGGFAAHGFEQIRPHNDQPEVAEDSIEEIAEDLCIDWLNGQEPSVVAAIDRAEKIDKEPVDIHNALIARCAPYAQANGELPAEAWDDEGN